ncbi:hypothetical protein ACS0TY_025129 [Phlomoides rotata]
MGSSSVSYTTSLLFNMMSIIITIIIRILIIQPNSCTAQQHAYRNISLGASIVTDDANTSTWLSPSGEFAFGFQHVAQRGYLLAVWFNRIPEKTIVWSANRDDLAPQGSRIQLLSDGRLQLNDPRGRVIWAGNPGRPRVAYAALLDTGDFVLATNTSSILWRSFDEPTDTLLPSQILDQQALTSSFSDKNYSRGRFMLMLQDGNLELYTRNFPLDDTILAYWSTGTNASGSRLIFNQSGNIYVARNESDVLANLSSNGVSTSQFYQRLTLEYDGVLRHYLRPKFSNSTGGRAIAWSVNAFKPEDICKQMGFTDPKSIRGGACGYNALCSLETADQRPVCSCPTSGYSRVDPNDPLSGCKQDFVPQSCDKDSEVESDLFSLYDFPNTDWPFSDYASLSPITEDQCRQACLADCYCAVAVYTGQRCIKKNTPLSNGRLGYSEGIKAMGQFCWAVLLLASVALLVYHFNRRKTSKINGAFPGVCIASFSFKELEKATGGFKEKLGTGACSTVYRGVLDEKVVAVKKLDKIAEAAEQEFKAEVSSISRTNHKNLVQLLGYCDEGENKLLVYEFMSNGSLADLLFGSSPKPNWYRRLQIAFATARALCYLHEECSAQIIHCDIKPQNVLLDDTHTPKISDFGLAKLLRPDQTETTTGIRGTRGYVAPEWFRNMAITAKIDVYSFGIMLLELLCCRRNYEAGFVGDEGVILADWAYDCYKEGRLVTLIAHDEEAKDENKLFEKLVMVAMWCIQWVNPYRVLFWLRLRHLLLLVDSGSGPLINQFLDRITE